MDAAYVQEAVGDVLTDGLAAVVAARPRDPIEYLGAFLLKQAERMESAAADASMSEQLEKEQAEADTKQQADLEATKEEREANEAAQRRRDQLRSDLAEAQTITAAQLREVANVLMQDVRAAGVFIARKDPLDGAPPAGVGGEDEEAEDDEGAGGPVDSQITYLAASEGSEHMLGQHPLSNEGVTFDAWKPVKAAGADGEEEEEEEEEDEDGEGEAPNKPPPPPPELPVVRVSNTLRESRMVYLPSQGPAVPKLGQYLAVPARYMSSLHASCIPEEKPKEEGEGDGEGDGEDGEDEDGEDANEGEDGEGSGGEGEGKEGDGEGEGAADAQPAEEVIPDPVQKEVLLAVCVDTLGRDVRLGPEAEAAAKGWAEEVAKAYERSERAEYEAEFQRHKAQPALEAAALEALQSEEAAGFDAGAEEAAAAEVEAAAKEAEDAAAKAADEAAARAEAREAAREAAAEAAEGEGEGEGGDGAAEEGGAAGEEEEEELPSGELPADVEALIRARHSIGAAAKSLGLGPMDALRKHVCSRALSPAPLECQVMAAVLHLCKGSSKEDLGDPLARDAAKVRWGTVRELMRSDGLQEELAAVAGREEGPRADLAREALGSMAPAPAVGGAAGDGEEGEDAEAGGEEEEGGEGASPGGLSPLGQALLGWCKAALKQCDAVAARKAREQAEEAKREARREAAAARAAGGDVGAEGEGEDEDEDE